MIKFNYILGFFAIISFSFEACSSDDATVTEESEDDTSTDTVIADSYSIQESYFNSASFVSMEIITATLENNTQAVCYLITFSGDGVDGDYGPFCPETFDDVGGLAVYDGETNPGLNVIDADLLNAIEADGYDIVDEDGNVFVVPGYGDDVGYDHSNCLALDYDPELEFQFIIPVEPVLASSSQVIAEVEHFGVSLDGTPLTGDPPSATTGPAMFGGFEGDEINFPSLDPCGGHPDPAGYYHLHFIPQVMNQVLEAQGISKVSCELFEQTTDVELVGFAKDGIPIYAYAEMPEDLDDCNGHTAATTEYPNGIYHYVASTTDVTNMPPCLKGYAVRDSFTYN